MSGIRLAGALLAAFTLLTGCSGEEGATPPERPGPTETPAAPALSFGEPSEETGEERIVIGCAERYPTVTLYDEVTADRDLTLDSVSVVGDDGVAVVQSWVSSLPEGRVSTSGVLAKGAGGVQRDDIEPWADRGPLAGTGLTSGSTYEYFLELSIEPDQTVTGFEFSWTADGEASSSTYELDLRTRAACPSR